VTAREKGQEIQAGEISKRVVGLIFHSEGGAQ